MTMNIKSNIIIAAKLALICFVCVLLLSIVYLVASPQIAKQKKARIKQANSSLFPSGKIFEKMEFNSSIKKNGEYYYIVKDAQNKLIGYIANVYGSGYGGTIALSIAFSPKLEVLNMKMLDNAETPGFGKKWETQKSMNMFVGTNTEATPFPKKKFMVAPEFQQGPNGVTGATITFNGIAAASVRAIEMMNNL